MMSEITIFDHYSYAKKIKDLLNKTFPILQTVSFDPALADGTETRFGDLAVPAFLMRYANPEILSGLLREDFDNPDAYYLKVRINVEGLMFMPWVVSENPNVPDNINPSIGLVVAVMNIAAKIQADAGGFTGGVARIDEIDLDEELSDDKHKVGAIRWSHDAFIGSRPAASGQVPNQLYGLFDPCPDPLKTSIHNLIYENPS